MIVFVSNYYNHHQAPLSKELYAQTNGQYRFIATKPMDPERRSMGWEAETAPYVTEYSENPVECRTLIDQAEVVIFGSAPYKLIRNRLRKGRLTFLYSERIYKRGCPPWQIPLRWAKFYWMYGRFENIYLLCASAYAAADYAKTNTFVGKAYRWGYFPEVKAYPDIEQLIKAKKPHSILWAARLIALKHPELPIQLAKHLKDNGYSFQLNMIGSGVLEAELRKKIAEDGLDDCVHMLGSMKPDQVRKWMEQSQIFLFTSDQNEGWGAVLNESMNSGCAVVASHAIGSVPFLLDDGKNGIRFRSGNEQSLYASVAQLLENPVLGEELGKNACQTMELLWNPKNAAQRLLILIDELNKTGICEKFETGPCSIAPIISDSISMTK